MIEYLDVISHSTEQDAYEIRAYLSNHSNPNNLAKGWISLEGMHSLFVQLRNENNQMSFDSYPGKVSKIEIDMNRKCVLLRVNLTE